MSGTIYDDNRDRGPTLTQVDPDFESELQCAMSSTSPVLITAPAEIAQAIALKIHQNSFNRRGAFMTVDCSRVHVPEQFEMVFDTAAPRGTVYLRDVDRLSPALQEVLYFRIAPMGVRVIAGTSVSLLYAAGQGFFDERLFYRINQVHLIATGPTPPTPNA